MSADNYVYVGRYGKRWFVEQRFASSDYPRRPGKGARLFDSYTDALVNGAEQSQNGYFEYGLVVDSHD